MRPLRDDVAYVVVLSCGAYAVSSNDIRLVGLAGTINLLIGALLSSSWPTVMCVKQYLYSFHVKTTVGSICSHEKMAVA